MLLVQFIENMINKMFWFSDKSLTWPNYGQIYY